jgi:hypothetical protein
MARAERSRCASRFRRGRTYGQQIANPPETPLIRHAAQRLIPAYQRKVMAAT